MAPDAKKCPQCGGRKNERFPLCLKCSKGTVASAAGQKKEEGKKEEPRSDDQYEILVKPTPAGKSVDFLVETQDGHGSRKPAQFLCIIEGTGVTTATTSAKDSDDGWPIGQYVVPVEYKDQPQKISFILGGRRAMEPVVFLVPAERGMPTPVVDKKKKTVREAAPTHLPVYDIEVDVVVGKQEDKPVIQVLVQTYQDKRQASVRFAYSIDGTGYVVDRTNRFGYVIIPIDTVPHARKSKWHVIGGNADVRNIDIPPVELERKKIQPVPIQPGLGFVGNLNKAWKGAQQ